MRFQGSDMHRANDYVIETRALSKRYGARVAIDRLDLAIAPGSIHAIVGANGAGKSTLFRILLGFLPATSGNAWILGRDCRELRPEDRQRIGFVNEEHTLPGWMTVAAVTAMQRRQYAAWSQPAFDEVIGHYHVRAAQKVSQLSRGERAGFNLALSLAQCPALLVLDEPTLGLDVVAKRAFLESLLHSNAVEGCTVIYCSHQMEEIERVADNLIIMERGALRNVSPRTISAHASRTGWPTSRSAGPTRGLFPGCSTRSASTASSITSCSTRATASPSSCAPAAHATSIACRSAWTAR